MSQLTQESAPRVSIVIPCHDDGRFLSEAIQSVPKTIPLGSEIIVVDDGSTDPFTISEIARFESNGIQVIRQRNLGLGAARNAGIRAAKTEYIIPLDCDNCLTTAYFEDGVRFLDSDLNVDVVYSDAQYFGEKEGPWAVGEFSLQRLVMANFIDACALFKRKVWEGIHGYDDRMPWMGWEDWDFWLRAANAGCQFHYLNRVGFHYRVRSGSMIRKTLLHCEELSEYIFRKPELRALRLARELNLQLEYFRSIEKSKTFQIAKGLERLGNLSRRALKRPR